MWLRKIVDLCDKRHDHVLRNIEKMFQDIGAPKFGAANLEAEHLDIKASSAKNTACRKT